MLLVIDSGNSRVKWALADQQGKIGPVNYAERGADLAQLGLAAASAAAAYGSDVVGPERRNELEDAIGKAGCKWIIPREHAFGVHNKYGSGELGSDRWCGLLALRAMHDWGIAVQCGTAVTIDLLDKKGVFCGGLILPGRSLMHESLADATRLPLVAADAPDAKPASTLDAIASGSLHAIAGAARLFAESQKAEAAPLIISGGGARQLAAMLPGSTIVQDLVLRGVVIAADVV